MFLLLANNVFASDYFWVSLLREDGVLVPFKTYQEGNWSSSWPEILEVAEPVKIEKLSDTPLDWLGKSEQIPTQWFLTEKNGVEKTINTSLPEVYNSHCGTSWGIGTDYPKVESRYGHASKVGVAFSKDVEMIPAVNSQNVDTASAITIFITNRFVETEEVEVQKKVSEGMLWEDRLAYTGHPIDSKVRNIQNITFNDLYEIKAFDGSNSLYYFYVGRNYEKPDGFSDRFCEAVSQYGGFILQTGDGEFEVLKDNFFITDCDTQNIFISEPFGIFRLGSDSFLIRETLYYESEVYYIDLIRDGKMSEVTALFGGGC
jgi:hypothetical protein